MALTINLLPPELRINKKLEAKKALITNLSITVFVLILIIVMGIIGLRFWQNKTIENDQKQIAEVRAKIDSFKDREILAVVLKDRLSSISSLSQKDSRQSQIYSVIKSLMPQEVQFTSFNVDKSGKVEFEAETTSTQALQVFFDNLTDPSNNLGKIVNPKIEGLNRAAGSNMRVDISFSLQGSKALQPALSKPAASPQPVNNL